LESHIPDQTKHMTTPNGFR